MSQTNPYSPPAAPVEDIELAPKRIPRTFLVLLAVYFLLEIAGTIVTGQYIALGRMVVLGIAAWRTLQGSRAAAFFLGGLFVLGVLLSIRTTLALWSSSPSDAIAPLAAMLLMATLAAYVFLSPGMRALYAKADESKWRAR